MATAGNLCSGLSKFYIRDTVEGAQGIIKKFIVGLKMPCITSWNPGTAFTDSLSNPAEIIADTSIQIYLDVIKRTKYYALEKIYEESFSHNLIVHPLPEVFAGNDTTICRGDTIGIGAINNGLQSFWEPTLGLSNPDSLQTLAWPEQTTQYRLHVSDAYCQNIDSVLVSVVIPEEPPLIFVINDSILQSSYTDNNEWYLNGEFSGIVDSLFQIASTGNYEIHRTDTNGCVTKSNSIFFNINKYNITGKITYSNILNTPLSNVNFYLKKNEIVVDSTISDITGAYIFQSNATGTYTLSAKTNKPWNGVNATDALIIERYISGLCVLPEPKLSAADVTLSNNITSTDALVLKRRVAGLINSFPSGDWYFQSQSVTLLNSDLIMNCNGICYGDVNGSYISEYSKINNSVNLVFSEAIDATKNTVIEIPIRTKEFLQTSAVTLYISYPQNKIEILSINETDKGLTGFETNISQGKISIVWNKIQPKIFQPQDVLFTFTARVISDNIVEPIFEILSESEFADEAANVMEGISLEIPYIQIGASVISKTNKNSNIKIYPNPAHDEIILNSPFNLQNAIITISDLFGKIIYEESILQNTFHKEISVKNFAESVYIVKVQNNNYSEIIKFFKW